MIYIIFFSFKTKLKFTTNFLKRPSQQFWGGSSSKFWYTECESVVYIIIITIYIIIMYLIIIYIISSLLKINKNSQQNFWNVVHNSFEGGRRRNVATQNIKRLFYVANRLAPGKPNKLDKRHERVKTYQWR